ncbi:MAG TPA: membrane protein insertase YidC, partial [Rubrivivax sp.]|nr:membrane protein insertase YidC [Rubrivivax sp.]
MTDIRRTLLWVVFTMSLVMLWDAWQKHTGQASIFGGTPRPAVSAAPPASASVPSAAGVPVASGAIAGAPAVAAVGAPGAGGSSGEQVVVTTDLVRATFDSNGATLVRLELLAYEDAQDPTRKVVLLDQSPKRLYLAQSGLITTQPGVQLANHLTPMVAQPGPRTLEAGANELVLRFESAAADGSKLVKTFTFKRGQYPVAVRHELINQGTTPLVPQLYLQLARDGTPPEGESSFYFTFTGPAVYTDVNKFQKIDFKDIAKGAASHDKSADNGWIAMVQHYFASAWLVPTPGPREFSTVKVGDAYFVRMVLPLGEVAPGAAKVHDAVL